ncbi:putative signaling protein CC_0091 [Massilia sp. Bi118]|uniref:putative bifunctional diguanylate cyclase/phosphodiesterase n=1 Tax=Massilia sp. Bi118 TaxID=2822346 RepID=UPI001DE3868F|nr:EAL domain-containing protein [Massilia sp. Bi118]CAH0190907.1 putative signaling protein CC_0091 [Massilia sp. Bi118]
MVSVNDIAAWRIRIFSSLLSVVLALGAIAAAPSIPLLIHQGLWPVALMDTVALAWIFAIWRLERLPYRLRVLNFLAVLYAVAIALMLAIGPASLNYLLGPPVMAVILLGLRPAMGALALSAACIVALAGGGHVALAVPGMEGNALSAALAVTLNFTCVGAMIVLTSGTLLKGLSHTLAKVRGDEERVRALNDELQLTSAAVARLNDMVLIARAVDGPDVSQPVMFANDAFLRRTGYTRGEIIGRSMRVLHGPETDKATVRRILDGMARSQPVRAEIVNYTKDGEPYWVEMEMMPFARAGEHATHWVVVGRDITERRDAADAIHRLAFYDVLTGLPNRRLLMDRLDALLGHTRDGRGLGALLYIDLDNFKNINDARGHATGDTLLVQAAERLGRAVRQRDTVARLGGDEFVVLLDGLEPDPAQATRAALAVADKIRAALAEPIEIDGQAHHTSASIGVALPLHAETAHDLLREADTAMYHAKAGGRNGVALFETDMLADAQRRLSLERDLALALENGELAMHLQLQVGQDGLPAGAELLTRWRRADGSFVPPDVFIPLAEASGLIVPLGRWVLRQACQAWLALDAAGHPLPLSINVSPLQFRQPDFVAQVRAVLQETGAPPQQLIFEVTEGLLIEDIGKTIARMRELAALGIRFSIDDFGTGYSNLAYLKKMPLYELKIDKSFMRDTPHDANGTAIVQSILAMAGHLGLRVVAEGIESDDQARFLAGHGSPYMQGYLFHRPMPLEQLIARLAARTDKARA